MSEYYGSIEDVYDAFIVVEAARKGLLKMTNERSHRLNLFKNNVTIILKANSNGMKRWTDGLKWTSSRLVNGFFMYQYQRNQKSVNQMGLNFILSDNGSTVDEPTLNKKAITVVCADGNQYKVIHYYRNESFRLKPKHIFNKELYSQLESKVIDYRYFSCFRSKSKKCRELLPAPQLIKYFDKPTQLINNCYLSKSSESLNLDGTFQTNQLINPSKNLSPNKSVHLYNPTYPNTYPEVYRNNTRQNTEGSFKLPSIHQLLDLSI